MRTRSLIPALFVLLAFIAVFYSLTSPAFAQAQKTQFNETAPDYYDKEDFYYWEKDRTRTILYLYPKAVVVYPAHDAINEPAKFGELLQELNLTSKDGVVFEKRSLPLGIREARTVIGERVYYVLFFSRATDVLSVIKTLVSKNEIVFNAFPVFWMDEEMVFPAGVWVKSKQLNTSMEQWFEKKISQNGFEKLWRWPSTPSPSIPRRLDYWMQPKGRPVTMNPLRLSRLLAEDIMTEWVIPDFVSVNQPLQILPKISRPSGTMNDPFVVTYGIRYDERRLNIDVEALKNMAGDVLRPKDVMEELFWVDTLSVREEKNKIIISIVFRMYQPGDFNFSPPDISFRIKGGSSEDPPIAVMFPVLSFKVVGLVPRDGKGEPLISDIFPLKQMPVFEPVLPQEPKKLSSPPSTDIRFWAKGWVLKSLPGLPGYLKNTALLFFAAGLAGLAIAGAVKGFALIRNYRRSSWHKVGETAMALCAALNKRGDYHNEFHLFEQASKARLRFILQKLGATKIDEGTTNKEMLELVPERHLPRVKDILKNLSVMRDIRPEPEAIRNMSADLRWGFFKLRIMRQIIPRWLKAKKE